MSQHAEAQLKVSIVIPAYRSEKSLPVLLQQLFDVGKTNDWDLQVVVIDDASPDDTWAVLKRAKEVYGTKLRIARVFTNGGQHRAIQAGFTLVTGDIVVTMDDDLQHRPEDVVNLVDAVCSGYDLAIGSYSQKKHSQFRNTAGGFIDRLIKRIFKLPPSFELTSFRAMKRSVVEGVLAQTSERPYITAMLLANSSNRLNVPVVHKRRAHGSSNYTLARSLSLAASLIFSYSAYPIVFVAALCALAFSFSAALGVGTIWRAVTENIGVPGWASLVVVTTFFNGLILLALLVYGIYLSRIYLTVVSGRLSNRLAEID
ncbi:glycosyltransferase [Mycobacterium bourgelatii]|uniref:glycosyltransferase n=1 Tax=Mycobacterium bourgelatii TaxID=1273442 RepID=UPI001963253B|nr:glycosyltransferase [Mycobacterium bourgelatii]MCV6974079.1 glycosyltransferase [Mycobacterium bourgelatii]